MESVENTKDCCLSQAEVMRTVAEEMPHAYKDVADVVEVMEVAGVSQRVARLAPMGVVKG